MTISYRTLLLAGIAALAAGPASAVVYKGGTLGDWSTTTNWVGGTPPDTSTVAQFTAGSGTGSKTVLLYQNGDIAQGLVSTGTIGGVSLNGHDLTLSGSNASPISFGGTIYNSASPLSTLTFGSGSGKQTLTNAISGNTAINVSGGTLVFTGANGANSYSGGTTIGNGGTLTLTGEGNAGTAAIQDNGVLHLSGVTTGISNTSLSGNGTVNLGGKTLTLTAPAGTFSGEITGTVASALTLTGSGSETLSGTNTYGGTTTIGPNNTLVLTSTGSITNSTVVDNGAFDITATSGTTIKSLSGNGSVNLGSATLSLSAPGGTFGGVISGVGGGLTLKGTGVETLTGANTYTGTTTIGGNDTLVLSGGGRIDSSAVTDNGTFDISATTNGASIRSLQGGGTVVLDTKTLTLTGATGTFSGNITSATTNGGGLTIGGGAVTLSGVNTYTGATAIDSGAKLTLGKNGSIADSSGVVNDGTFTIAGDQTIKSLSSNGSSGVIDLADHLLTLSDASGTYAGGIGLNGGGSLTIGGGHETLNGAGTYGGATTIKSGASLTLNGTLTRSTVTVESGGHLNGTGTIGTPTTKRDLFNSGVVAPGDSPGKMTVNGNYTQDAGGELDIAIDSPSSYSSLVVTDSVFLGGALDLLFSNTFSGSDVLLASILQYGSDQLSGGQPTNFSSLEISGASCSAFTYNGNNGSYYDYTATCVMNYTDYVIDERIYGTHLDLLATVEAPEPGALAILATGLLGLAGVRRRRRA